MFLPIRLFKSENNGKYNIKKATATATKHLLAQIQLKKKNKIQAGDILLISERVIFVLKVKDICLDSILIQTI